MGKWQSSEIRRSGLGAHCEYEMQYRRYCLNRLPRIGGRLRLLRRRIIKSSGTRCSEPVSVRLICISEHHATVALDNGRRFSFHYPVLADLLRGEAFDDPLFTVDEPYVPLFGGKS